MDKVRNRLLEFLEYKGLEKSVFERMCGLANGFVDKTNARMRRTSLKSISNTFPELNTNWLMSGDGNMIQEVQPKQEQEHQDDINALLKRIDKLIEIHERDSKNMERLLTLLLERCDSTKEKAVI